MGGPLSATGRGRIRIVDSAQNPTKGGQPFDICPTALAPDIEAAVGFIVATGSGTVCGSRSEVIKCVHDLLALNVGQPERPDPGGVDHPPAVR